MLHRQGMRPSSATIWLCASLNFVSLSVKWGQEYLLARFKEGNVCKLLDKC